MKWLEEDLEKIKLNYKKGDAFLSEILGRSIQSVKTKRVRLGYRIGNPSKSKGLKRGKVVKWSPSEDKIIKEFYPILGYSKPIFTKSIADRLPKKTQPQIRYRAESVFKLKIDRQGGLLEYEKRCSACLAVKDKVDFSNDETFQCKVCKNKIWVNKRYDWRYAYLDRYRARLRNEGNQIKPAKSEKLFNQIIENIGEPISCFFNDEYCKEKEYTGNHNLEFGHIVASSRGGSISDYRNVIWLCRRHNLIMGNNNLKELKDILESLLKNYNV